MEERLSREEFESLKRTRLAEDPKYATIAARLRELFWDDTCNDVTIRFYARIQDECILHGEPVRRHVKGVAASALSARNPVRYFAASITRRLREHGYLQDERGELGL